MQKSSGVFVSFEGGEGVGKSSLIREILKELEKNELDVLATFEPGGTKSADLIRGLFASPPTDEPWLPQAEFLLVSAARTQHAHYKIRPMLARGGWVLCDRFTDSTLVYQGILGNVDMHFMQRVMAETSFGLKPDLTFLLDCPVEIVAERIRQRPEGETTGARRFDEAGLDVHKRIREGFLELQQNNPERILLIDAAMSLDEVKRRCIGALKKRFKFD